MARKVGLDQTAAWILSFFVAGLIFAGLWFFGEMIATKRAGKAVVAEKVEKKGERPNFSEPRKKAPQSVKKWSYEGERGPEYWGDLSGEYFECKKGRKQSPVDIETFKKDISLQPILFAYKNSDIQIKNSGVTLSSDYDEGSYISLDDVRYDLKSLEFHLPSEHKVKGIPYEMELQLLHKSAKGDLAIISIFLEEGERSHKELNTIWHDLPAMKGNKGPIERFNVKSLLPTDKGYYTYDGSLTSPPCTEGVKWFVLQKSIKVSSKQIDQFNLIIRQNARPVQPLNGRSIKRSTKG